MTKLPEAGGSSFLLMYSDFSYSVFVHGARRAQFLAVPNPHVNEACVCCNTCCNTGRRATAASIHSSMASCPPVPPTCEAEHMFPSENSAMETSLCKSGSSNAEGSVRTTGIAPWTELMNVPKVNECGIRVRSIARGNDIERETAVRCASGKYVAFGSRVFNSADTAANKVASKILPS